MAGSNACIRHTPGAQDSEPRMANRAGLVSGVKRDAVDQRLISIRLPARSTGLDARSGRSNHGSPIELPGMPGR